MRKIFTILLLKISFISLAQEQYPAKDSTQVLQEVVIQAYATGRPLSEVPAAVGYISTDQLQRFNNTSFLPVVNTVPGVRMEERSPGSYRFSMRGSSFRFGMRIHWNESVRTATRPAPRGGST